ncbi:L-fucose/L-arabinose isomerase family protein [Hoeflea sp. TYP-13]|uniref:L-fucose/L-arabinose isomerase family protein n=1 Tax=Hoeflea sp. TYP-13 TaxID=3230023 RepID=UPI0034C6A7E6
MRDNLTIGVIHASLPSYFPDEHNVFEDCQKGLQKLCDAEGARLIVAPDRPMNGSEARKAAEFCRSEGADFLLLIHGGFTMGDVAHTLATIPVPMGVWATPEPTLEGDIQLNNFVSLNMTMSIAKKVRDLKKHPLQWYFGAPGSPEIEARFTHTFRALAMVKAMTHARIALIGGLAPTFYNMEVSSNTLKQRFQIDVEAFEMAELTGRMSAIDPSRASAEIAKMAAAATVDGVTDDQMELSARKALALRDACAEGEFDALAVSDWPALQVEPGMHPGAAFTWLEEVDGIPVASEGDLLGAVTQLAAKSMTGKVGYLLDMTEPDLDHGDLLMWHGGGGPLYLADDAGARWINHPMIGRGTEEGPRFGTISDLVFRDGAVTAMRISDDATAIFDMEARVVGRSPTGFSGCRGWLRGFSFAREPASLDDVITTVMGHGVEHHFVLVPGHHHEVLAEFAAWAGLAPLKRLTARNHLDPGL